MKYPFDIGSKVVLVSGGAGLLGEIFARSICEQNATAVIAEKNIRIAEECRIKLQQGYANAKLVAVEMDITSQASIDSAIERTQDQCGKIDALVNNAYPRNENYGRAFEDVEYSDFCENIGMNLGGYFLTSQRFVKYFRDQGVGNIVNISSIYGVIAPRFEVYKNTKMTMPVEYAIIKSGLIHLTRYMSKYLKGTGIRVNSISPGGIYDNQDPLFIERYNEQCLSKGMLDKDDVTGALIFLLSEASSYINGQNIIVDDGFTL